MHLSVSVPDGIGVRAVFLVVFWYVVGGIWLAVIACGLVALAEQWPQPAARQRFAIAADIMAWVPSRLLACTFGVAGDLAGWSRSIRLVVPGLGKPTDNVLMTAASGSLTGYALDPERFGQVYADDWPKFGGRSIRAMRDLLSRSMLVWICAIALLVIAGRIFGRNPALRDRIFFAPREFPGRRPCGPVPAQLRTAGRTAGSDSGGRRC